ncbi:MAG: phage tail protein, partial [Campylobacter sp.]|nr:phage tail protein [Campylobacter sp.]
NMAKTYKPLLSEGSAKEVIIEIIIEVANASEVVINIDNSIVLATREFVKSEIKNIYTKLNDYYTKGQSDAKFELKGFGYSKAELNALIDKKPNLDAVYTKATSDQRYLGINAKAKDSDKLDGLDSSSFARAGSSYSKAEIDAKFGDGVLPFGARAGVVIGGGRFLKTINCNITETPRVQLLGGKWDSLYYLINLNFANATAVNMCFFEEEIKTENIGEKNDTKYEYKLSTIELIKHSNKAFKIPKRNVDGKSPSNDLKQYLGRKIHKGAHSGFILFF